MNYHECLDKKYTACPEIAGNSGELHELAMMSHEFSASTYTL